MSDTEDNVYKPPHIKYGSIISISHFQDDNAFIYADGHVKKEVLLKSFSLYKRAEQLRLIEKKRKKKQRNRREKTLESQNQQSLVIDEHDLLMKNVEEDDDDFDDEEDENIEQLQTIEEHGLQQTFQSDLKLQSLQKFDMDENADVSSKIKQYTGQNQLQPLIGNRDVDQKLKASTRKKLRKQKALASTKKNFNQNKQSFSNCLFMIFPKLSNTQKTRVVKNLGYESEESEDELDDAETIFNNPYDEKIELPNGNKASLETQLALRKISTLQYQGSPKQNPQKDKEKSLKDDKMQQQKSIKDGQKKDKNQLEDQKDDQIIEDDDGEEEVQDQDILDRDHLDKQKINLLNEYKANFDTFKKSIDSTVSYNSVIQLLHLNSSKWLSIKPIEARLQKENFRMTLEAYTSDNTMFKILPAFKYQKDGEQSIFANEIVYISRAQDINNRQTFLNISQEVKTLKQPQQIQASTYVNLPTTTNLSITQKKLEPQVINKDTQQMPSLVYPNPRDSKLFLLANDKQEKYKAPITNTVEPINKREINGSQEDQTNFKLNLFQENNSNFQQYLKCGDVIWLHHSEATGQIGVSRKDKGVNKVNHFLNIHIYLYKVLFHPPQSQQFFAFQIIILFYILKQKFIQYLLFKFRIYMYLHILVKFINMILLNFRNLNKI